MKFEGFGDIPALKDPDLELAFMHSMFSTKASCSTYFPERFFRPFSRLHDEIFDVLDDDTKQKVVIAAPRGFGKTTIDTIAHPAKRILFREKKYIVPISATATSALLQGENLKNELTGNPIIRQFFGNMKTRNFSKEQWVTSNDIMVMPRGAGQQVRGLLFNRYRPDLILADDLETKEGTRSQEQREKLAEWWETDVCNSIDRGSDDWKIVIVGTILHEDSLLANLIDDPEWHSVQLSICDDDFNSLWPDFISTEAIKRLYHYHKNKGKADLFFQEYRNMAVSSEDASFKNENFRYYTEQKLAEDNLHNMRTMVIVDPAKTVKLQSADSAIVGITIDRTKNAVYVRDIVSEKFYPDQLYDAMFKMVKGLNATILAIEETSLNEFIKQPVINECRVRGIWPTLIWLNPRASKEERVGKLADWYRPGYVFHNMANCLKLEAQLLSFPKSKSWDIMDAVAYFIQVMNLDEHFFDPPPLEDDEDEFAQLENDKSITTALIGEPTLDYQESIHRQSRSSSLR